MSDVPAFPMLTKGKYRHNKSGKLYEVVGVAQDTERNEAVVVYAPLYNHEEGYELFTRPYTMFVENVNLDGAMVPRFEKIDD